VVNRADQVAIFHEGFLIHLSEAQWCRICYWLLFIWSTWQ